MLSEKSICGLDSGALNELLECCTDPSHIVPDGSKVVEATLVPSSLDQQLEMDMKLWDFDPNCFLDICKDSHADSVTPPSLTHSEELNNTPCCSKEMMLCDLDEHLSNKELNHLDNLLACCINNEGSSIDFQPPPFLNPPPLAAFNACHASSDSIILENTSDIRDTLRTRINEEQQQFQFPHRHQHQHHHHHHHHLLHLHHHDPTGNEQMHAHDLILHHHNHDTKDFPHHHHLKLPDGFNGQNIQREFILPQCKNKAPVLKSSILDENGRKCTNSKVQKASGGCCDKRRNLPLDIEQNKKLLHDRLHNHLIKHHHNQNYDTLAKPMSEIKIKQEDKECQWLDCSENVNPADINEHILQAHLYDLPAANAAELYKCEWKDCSFTFEDIDQLYNHIPSHTDVKLESPTTHTCKWINTKGVKCNLEFPDTETLTTHLIEEHIGSGQSKYLCQWENCDRNHKPFNQRQKIIRHLNTHTKHKPFKCEVCNRTFSLELMLKQHMRTHTGETPYKCDECDKEFKTSSSLTIHKRVHSGIKPMECKICGKRFNESSNLNKHMKIHSRKYKCQHCHKSFDLKEKFERHQTVCRPSTFSI